MPDHAPLFARIVGNVLREVRLEGRVSLGAVARRSSGRFPPSTVGGYERGERAITLQRFHELAEIYGVPADRLLRRVLERLAPEINTGVTVDLRKLSALPADERRALGELVDSIRSSRDDYLGDIVSLRAGDLQIVAGVTGRSPNLVLEALRPALKSEPRGGVTR